MHHRNSPIPVILFIVASAHHAKAFSDDLLTVDFPLAAKVSEAQQHLKTQYSSEGIEKESLIGPETTGNSHIPFKREILPKEGEKEEEGGDGDDGGSGEKEKGGAGAGGYHAPQGGGSGEGAPMPEQKPVANLDEDAFMKEALSDISSADLEASEVPAKITKFTRKKSEAKGKEGKKARPLDVKVNRFKHKDMLGEKDVEGSCGRPICALIDSRPKRFASLCNFTLFLKENHLSRQLFHIQKGDCADAIERKGHDWVWGSEPKSCDACKSADGCKEKVCVAAEGIAQTFPSVCDAIKAHGQKKSLITMYWSLGDCKEHFDAKGWLYTEWFDIDEPCKTGDTESASQNLAMVTTYKLTSRFRMCPKARQVGEPEFQTLEGSDVPPDQVVERDLKNHRLVCLNEKQVKKPGPPHYWFVNKIKCRDYKIRHKCKCLHGCYPPEDGKYKIDVPAIKTIFDECEWQPFVSHETPQTDTWDGEDRAHAIEYGTPEHVCGGSIFNAMYIDSRTREEDTPWDETGQIITKNTPFYGFLCLNKNNKPYNKLCSDYKVRYCCKKRQDSQWGSWSKWSKCTKTCGGGTRTRDRVCVKKEGSKETCFGNWIDKDEKGNDRHANLKKQVHKCKEISCPDDANFTPWMAWESCPVTCGQAKKRRRRGCDPPRHGGKDCPSDRKQYEEFVDCGGASCPDPQWTKWSAWGQCSMTCGLGKKRRTRKCEDAVTKQPMQANLDCLGGGVEMSEDCKEADCGIDGKWTEWLNWSTCSVLCGKQGHRIRKRYCTNPLPQFGGKKCPGNGEMKGDCLELKPCPVHCEWSLWGSWSDCSVSCGSPGQGTQTRGRHVAQEAKFGGRQCTGIKTENAVCLHEKMKSDKARFDEAIKAGAKPIYYCPVDCVWGEWTPWSLCPDCFGEESGIMEEDLKEFEQTRTRKVKVRPKFRGKKCGKSFFEMGTQKKCTKGTVPPCPEAAGAAFVSQWLHWGTCRAPCGKDGTRERTRQCHGEECKDELEEKAKCKGYCPPMGWSNWDQWSNCPVTCGKAQRARVRHCRDDAKEEMKNNSTCRGVARETQRCDMGKCGSKIELKYEGGKGDPIEKLEKKYEKEETEFEKNSATKTAEKGDSKSQGKASSASDGMAGGHESGGGGQEGKESPKIEKLPAREGKENSKEKANPSAAPPKEENKGGKGSMNSMESKESKEGSESKEKKASNSPGYGTQGGGNKGQDEPIQKRSKRRSMRSGKWTRRVKGAKRRRRRRRRRNRRTKNQGVRG